MEPEIDIVELMKGMVLFGLWRDSDLRLVRRDVSGMMGLYREFLEPGEFEQGRVFVVTENDRLDGEFRLFVGGERMFPELEQAWIPPGLFAHLVLRPRLGIAWPAAVRRAKRHFYSTWLPGSGMRSGGVDFQLLSAESHGKQPRSHLYFSVVDGG